MRGGDLHSPIPLLGVVFRQGGRINNQWLLASRQSDAQRPVCITDEVSISFDNRTTRMWEPEVLTVVKMLIAVVWVMKPCIFVGDYQFPLNFGIHPKDDK
jgi:hypothetical protein